jgi:lipopolysaccharide export system permease protein
MRDRNKLPFARAPSKYTINIDLSQLNKVDINDQNIANTNTMLTVNELKYTLDSLDKI